MASREKKPLGNKYLALKKDLDAKTVKLAAGKQEGIVRKLGRPPKSKDHQSNIVRAKKCIWKHRPKLALALGRRKAIRKSVSEQDGGVDSKSANDVLDVQSCSNNPQLTLSPSQSNHASENDIQDVLNIEGKQEPSNSTGSTIKKEPVKVKKRFKKRITVVAEPSAKPKKIRAKASIVDDPGLDSLSSTQVGVPYLAPPKKLGRPSLKVKRGIQTSTLSAVNLEARNGTRLKVRPSPYTTRSGVPPQLLRNGKRRKFKEPMGSIDIQTPKTKRRRRLLSTTTDGSNVDSLNDPFVEEQAISRIGSESDSSFLDSYQMENGTWDSDIEMKPLEAFNKDGMSDTSRPYINGEPSKSKEKISETAVSNHAGKSIDSKVGVPVKKSKSLHDCDVENDEVFDVLSTANPNAIDNSPKTDSNSNLCEINNLTEDIIKTESPCTNNRSVNSPKTSKVVTKKIITYKGEDHPVNAAVTSELTPCISTEGTSKNLETLSLGSDRIERASSPNSLSTGTDRALTPSENWETLSVTSTPSSKNFDASFDDISEKDTDCENGKDMRRSQRSSIRKSRAALLRLATRKRGTGKTDKSGDSVGDIQLAIGGVFGSAVQDEVGLVRKDIKVGEVNDELSSTREVATKKSSKENVSNVIIENQDSMCSVAKVIESVVEAQVGGTIMPMESKQCRKPNLVKKRSLKTIERIRRVKSLNAQDIVHMVQNDLCTFKKRRASDFGLSISDISTMPQGTKEKSNKPVKYKLKRSLDVNTLKTNKSLVAKDVLGTGKRTTKGQQETNLGISLSEKNDSRKSSSASPTVLQGNKINKPRKYKLKRLTEVTPFDKVILINNSIAGGSKSESANTCRDSNKNISTNASSKQPEICESLLLGRKSCSPGPAGKALLKTRRPFPRVLAPITPDEDVMVIEAKLLKNAEAVDSVSKFEHKDETKLMEGDSGPVKSANTSDLLRDEDMAAKLRELSKKIESESDMFPSLYVKPLIPLSLKMEPNENFIPLKKEQKMKAVDTTFKDNKSMPVLKKEKKFGDIESEFESKRGDSKLDDGPPSMDKMEITLESTDSTLIADKPINEDAAKTPTEVTNMPTGSEDSDMSTGTIVQEQIELPTGTLEKDSSPKETLDVTDKSCTSLDSNKEENTSETNANSPCIDNSSVVDEKEQLLPANDIELPVHGEKKALCLDPVVKELSDTAIEKETAITEQEGATIEMEETTEKEKTTEKEDEAIEKEKTSDKVDVTVLVLDVLNGTELCVPPNTHAIEKDASVNIDLKHLEVSKSTESSSCMLLEDVKLSESSEKEAQCSDTSTLATEGIGSGKRLIEEETPENMAVKETVLGALGLLSLEAASAAKNAKCNVPRARQDSNYTGTLKTIIKVQRSPEKRTRPLKMILKNNKPSKRDKGYDESETNGFQYSICKEAGPSTDDLGSSSSAGVGNHITSNPQLFVEDTVPAEPAEQEAGKEGEKKQLVIPEKASSFSIHPGRLCSDVCSYCFGKFGSLDTPCHVAQLKGSERQVNILQAELHLTADSCLCDACYRHVDRKANCPTYREKTKGKKRLHHMSRAARPKATCCVLGCVQTAQHHVRRKWLTKLKRSIGKKVPVINNKLPPHVPLPLCSQHHAWVDHFMICGICRRRLNCNQMYPLGPEVHEINTILATDRIPVTLVEKVFLCKLCRYFTSLRTKFMDKTRLIGSHKLFYESYRKKILQYLDVEITEEPEPEIPKRKRRKMKVSSKVEVNGEHPVMPPVDKKQAEAVSVINLTSSEDSSPPSMDISSMVETQLVEPMIDYSTLGSDAPSVVNMATIGRPSIPAGNYRVEPVKPTKIRLTFGNTKPGPSNDKKSNNVVIFEREPEVPNFTTVLETPQLSVTANFDFRNPIPVKSDAEGEWEKCAFSLQYDRDSKKAFEKLKRPYGSQSSFFRHLLLLEQYWRSGELTAAPTSTSRTKSYLKSVQNRIDSFSMSVPSTSYATVVPKVQSTPATSVPIIDLPLRRLSGGIVTTAASPSPRPPVFTCTSAGSMPSTSVTNPMFISQMPPSKKYVINPATGQYVPSKRKPNIVQVTKGGQPLFRLVDPTKSQIRALQGYKRKVPTATVTSDNNDCVPLICDVRSLGEEGTKLWNTKPTVNVVAPVTNQPPKQKNAISILPKPLVVGPKPNTVLTPTGIILSKKLDISVSPIVKKDDLTKS